MTRAAAAGRTSPEPVEGHDAADDRTSPEPVEGRPFPEPVEGRPFPAEARTFPEPVEGHEPPQDPLVLLPGSGCTAALWSRLDLPAGAVTPVLEADTLDAEVDRLLAVLPPRFALAGLSLGAIVAMALVRRAPRRVTRLCLMSTNPYAPTPAQHATWAAQREVLATDGTRALQTSLLPVLRSPDRTDLDATLLGMADALGAATYAAQCRLQDTRVDERPGLARVRCPTLVVAARGDRLCPLDRHEEIARLVPGAELVVLEDCAHLSPLEQPALVTDHLRRWLAPAA